MEPGSGPARQVGTGKWVEISSAQGFITRVDPAEGRDAVGPGDLWVAPGFWDIQTNGRWGISFSDPHLVVSEVAEVVRAQRLMGTARVCPTLITADPDALLHGVRTIAATCDQDPLVAAMVVGIHLEGPYLSDRDGYRGAHPLRAIRDPSWDEFAQLQDAAGGRIVLMTLAPERAGSIPFIERLVASGVTVALGHTAADRATLEMAKNAGATLSTHLGNGIASPLPRHPNPIWDQAAMDGLSASLIADGHHLEPNVLRTLVRAKTASRVILVSDASPLAGLAPGRYGEWEVVPEGKVIVAGTPYLAGSNRGIADGVATLVRDARLTLADAVDAATINPAKALGHSSPAVSPGNRADLVRFHWWDDGRLELADCCVAGEWVAADPDPSRN